MKNSFFQKRVSMWDRFRRSLALHSAKLIRFMLIKLGRNATSFPGVVASKIYPKFLSDACFGRMVVFVTGTNGKTTCAKILTEIMQVNNRVVVSNSSGANMEDGLISTLVENDRQVVEEDPIIVFETDEGWVANLSKKCKPAMIIVLNFFRDQLDRYGELNRTREIVKQGINKCTSECHLILCADDPLVASLALDTGKEASFFGLKEEQMQITKEKQTLVEAAHCPDCHEPMIYERVSNAHLGDYHCSSCSFKRPTPNLSFAPREGMGNLLTIEMEDYKLDAELGIAGQHNLYNASAALLAAIHLDADFETSVAALAKMKAGFGRMEAFSFDSGKKCPVMLVKNPAAMGAALQHILKENHSQHILFSINDQANDGKDLSWIWDIDFEEFLKKADDKIDRLLFSGTRAAELALRIYYAGFPLEKIKLCKNNDDAVNSLLEQMEENETAYILPNYTAMLELRPMLEQLSKNEEAL